MVPSLSGFGSALMIYAILLILVIVTHGVWMSQVVAAVSRTGWRTTSRIAVIVLAALSPVVGPYCMLVYQWMHAPKDHPQRVGLVSTCMPVISLATIFFCAVSEDKRYIEVHQSWSNVTGFLPGMVAGWLVIHAVVYIAGYVFGLVKQNLILTRAHLISSAMILGLGFG